MIPAQQSPAPQPERIPRESGDDPAAVAAQSSAAVYSPRERG